MKQKCSRTACEKVCELPYIHLHTGQEYCAHCGFKINAACEYEYPNGICVLKPEFQRMKDEQKSH